MVRYLAESEKRACRGLWEEAFPEDSPEFCDYYFTEKVKDNRILVREEAGDIQAMLHLNPYRLAVGGHRFYVDYLVGVATKADCRRRGFMKELLAHMFAGLYEAGMPFVFLMPAAKEIYQPFGFVYIFDQPIWELKEPDKLARQANLGGVASWVDQWLRRNYQVYAIRDEAYLERLGKELASENGRMELLYDGNRMIGLYAEWGQDQPEQRFLYCENGYCEQTGSKPAIMARIVNLKSFITTIRLSKSSRQEEVTILLQVDDPWIAENDGRWRWHLAKETSWAEREATYELTAAEVGGEQPLKLSIGELAAWLFGYEIPPSARPYQGLVRTLEKVFLDEVV